MLVLLVVNNIIDSTVKSPKKSFDCDEEIKAESMYSVPQDNMDLSNADTNGLLQALVQSASYFLLPPSLLRRKRKQTRVLYIRYYKLLPLVRNFHRARSNINSL